MAAAFTAAIIASPAAGSKQRTSLASTVWRSPGPGRGRIGPCRRLAQAHDVTEDGDPEVAQEQPGQCAGGDAGRRFPGRGPLQDVAGVLEAVLEHARQVRMSRTRLGQHLGGGPGLGRHLLRPLRPFGIGNLDGHRRAQRAAVPDARHQGDLVSLEAHPRPTPEAEPPTGQFGGDIGSLHGQSRRAGPRRSRPGRGRGTLRRSESAARSHATGRPTPSWSPEGPILGARRTTDRRGCRLRRGL